MLVCCGFYFVEELFLLGKCSICLFCGSKSFFFLFCKKEYSVFFVFVLVVFVVFYGWVMLFLNCLVFSIVVVMVVGVLLGLECGLGLLGNAVALWIFLFRVSVWKSYVVYLFNLVLVDLLLVACLFFLVVFYLSF